MGETILPRGPRLGTYGDMPGAYALAIKQIDDTVNPGEILRLELFITGYGVIKSPKIAFFPSPTFVDPSGSKAVHSMSMEATEEPNIQRMMFGADTTQVGAHGTVIGLRGLQMQGWDQSTLIIDYPHPPLAEAPAPLLSTEQLLGGPPIALELRVASKARRGVHPLKFYMTYFDGQTWSVVSETLEVTVPPFHERSTLKGLVWTIGLITGLAAALGMAMAVGRIVLPFLEKLFLHIGM